MPDNRRGRRRNIRDERSEVHRRGEGLGTGPVGSGVGNNGHARENSDREEYSGQRGSINLSSGKTIIIIIIAAVLLFGGGGSFLSNILGFFGISTGNNGEISSTDTGVSNSILSSWSGYSSSGWSNLLGNNNGKLNNTVATGTRDKFTKLYGNGNDNVTIMLYMCGADLETQSGMATKDLMEMANAKIGNNVRIVAFTGGSKKWNNNVISSQKNQIYEVVQGGLTNLVDNAGNTSMTNSENLKYLIDYAKKYYPANRNILIFWDHGSGSVSGFGYDEKNPKSGTMSLAEIKKVIDGSGVKFDIVGFDACLMATYETAIMLKDSTDYLIASEETEPGIGWYYTDWLNALEKNPSISSVELGKLICDDFVSHCNSSCPGQPATLSVVDVAELAYSSPDKLNEYAKTIINSVENNSYETISKARSTSREFASGSRIDQVDLANFSVNTGTESGKALAKTIVNAVKYNRTTSNMTNAYGISIYFPYKQAKIVDKAVEMTEDVGLESDYAECIKSFAGLEVSGQAATGSTLSPLQSLLGNLTSNSSSDITSLLGGFLSGDFSSVPGLSSLNTSFLSGRSVLDYQSYLTNEDNHFDASNLKWTAKGKDKALVLPTSQWNLITNLQLNMFVDDGEGYIDLGLDCIYEFDNDGDLIADTGNNWLSVNGHIVAYYHEYVIEEADGSYTYYGYIPVLLNGVRAELIVSTNENDDAGVIAGARYVYDDDTDAVAKSLESVEDGDIIDFLCDYYDYDGEYLDSYKLGEQFKVNGKMEVYDIYVEGKTDITYKLTDIYNNSFWTLPIKNY